MYVLTAPVGSPDVYMNSGRAMGYWPLFTDSTLGFTGSPPSFGAMASVVTYGVM